MASTRGAVVHKFQSTSIPSSKSILGGWTAIVANGGGQDYLNEKNAYVRFLLDECGVSEVYSIDYSRITLDVPAIEVVSQLEDYFMKSLHLDGSKQENSTQ